MGKICAECGKKLSYFSVGENQALWLTPNMLMEYPQYKNKMFCRQCAILILTESPFREATEQGKRTLVVQDMVWSLFADRGKSLTAYANAAQKFGYRLKEMQGGILMVFEKAITTKDETWFVNCQYCKIRYDANQYFKCPQCGSPGTQELQKTSDVI
jgi:ssDNA-binding Zn-finger/Zn-ribbon topoisomerase 1